MAILLHLFHRRRQTRATRPLDHTVSSTAIIEGRRHRVDVPYVLPKDNGEMSRLNFQHYALRMILGADYLAPINSSTAHILDLGCGTGRWSLDMATQFPRAHIVGMDLELPTFHTAIPPCCQFLQGDILKTLPFPDQHFGFAHQRLLVGAIPTKCWPGVIRELVRITEPGGWIELTESGEEYLNPGPATLQCKQWWDQGSPHTGFDLSLIPYLDGLLSTAGLQTVQMKRVPIPLGKWAGRTGEMMAVDMHAVLRSFKGFYTTKLGIPAALFDDVVEALPQEWEQQHTSYMLHITFGQRPGTPAIHHLKHQLTQQ